MVTTAPNTIDFSKAVAAYGGFTGLAERLGLSLSTVHGWHLRKSVPVWRLAAIAAAAQADGINIKGKKRRNRRAKVRVRC